MAYRKAALISDQIGTQVRGDFDRQIVVGSGDNFFDRLLLAAGGKNGASYSGKLNQLDIYAHGLSSLNSWADAAIEKLDRMYAFVQTLSPERNLGLGNSSYGALIGNDNLTDLNVRKWGDISPIFADLAFINFKVCMMAKVSEERTTAKGHYTGNGIKLCQAIAAKSGAYVRASPSIQFYEEDGDGYLRFLDWNPPIFVFDPYGSNWQE